MGALVLLFIFLALKLADEARPLRIEVNDPKDSEFLRVRASFFRDRSYRAREISEVAFIEAPLNVVRRRGGYKLGGRTRGTFDVGLYGTALLSLDREGPPYVLLRVPFSGRDGTGLLILNLGDPLETQHVFTRLDLRLHPLSE